MSTITESIAAFAADYSPATLPAAVVEHAKLCILDATGIALASHRQPYAAQVLGAARALGGNGPSPVFGVTHGLPLRDALLVNGTLVHGLDFDDTHSASVVHCTASAWPLAFNLGLQQGVSGAAALAAYVLAVEIDATLGAAARGQLQKRGVHPTGVIAAFGCATAASWLQGLNPAQCRDALGIVLSMAGGSMEFLSDGASTKRMHPGWAAVCGVTAAALAAQGFSGPRAAIEGRFGLFNTLLGADHGIDIGAVCAGLGRDWQTLDIAFKPYPACHFNHAFADCALALKRHHGIAAADIAHITAYIHADQVAAVCEPLDAKRRPASAYEAQFSVPYMVASAWLRERFTLAELESAALRDADTLALAARVGYVLDPDSSYPAAYSAALEVVLHDGRRFFHREATNRGARDNPLSADSIRDKFFSNVLEVAEHRHAEQLAAAIESLDRAPDLGAVSAALRDTAAAMRRGVAG
ncbi:MAG: MmgE/PrpD family protein [Gammaproteobacteria bacterium]|nr:MmgE/PrpD family protein [Gammaproteobacteria bacterium]